MLKLRYDESLVNQVGDENCAKEPIAWPDAQKNLPKLKTGRAKFHDHAADSAMVALIGQLDGEYVERGPVQADAKPEVKAKRGRPKKEPKAPTPCPLPFHVVTKAISEAVKGKGGRDTLREINEDASNQAGVGKVAGKVLRFLGRRINWKHGLVSGCSVQFIADELGMDRRNVTRALKFLDDYGYILRDSDAKVALRTKQPSRYTIPAMVPELWTPHAELNVPQDEFFVPQGDLNVPQRSELNVPQGLWRTRPVSDGIKRLFTGVSGDCLDAPCAKSPASSRVIVEGIVGPENCLSLKGCCEGQIDPSCEGFKNPTIPIEDIPLEEESISLRSIDSNCGSGSKAIDADFQEVEDQASKPVASPPAAPVKPVQLALVPTEPQKPKRSTGTAITKSGKTVVQLPPKVNNRYQYDEAFLAFWKSYPDTLHSDDKVTIWGMFHQIIGGWVEDSAEGCPIEISADELIERAQQFAAHHEKVGTDPKMIPMMRTWLGETRFHGEKWEKWLRANSKDRFAAYRQEQEAKAKITQEARAKYPLQQAGNGAIEAEEPAIRRFVRAWAKSVPGESKMQWQGVCEQFQRELEIKQYPEEVYEVAIHIMSGYEFTLSDKKPRLRKKEVTPILKQAVIAHEKRAIIDEKWAEFEDAHIKAIENGWIAEKYCAEDLVNGFVPLHDWNFGGWLPGAIVPAAVRDRAMALADRSNKLLDEGVDDLVRAWGNIKGYFENGKDREKAEEDLARKIRSRGYGGARTVAFQLDREWIKEPILKPDGSVNKDETRRPSEDQIIRALDDCPRFFGDLRRASGLFEKYADDLAKQFEIFNASPNSCQASCSIDGWSHEFEEWLGENHPTEFRTMNWPLFKLCLKLDDNCQFYLLTNPKEIVPVGPSNLRHGREGIDPNHANRFEEACNYKPKHAFRIH